MTDKPKEWITVAEAATLARRHKAQIYRWIAAGRLATYVSTNGVTHVLSKAVLRVGGEVKRGRPRT
ncbi:helix-turn-helix domain-containing protein [Microbacterium allomyrinae]|uniref:Helix-turn-helix domain-containing protein n=1 Tax=Microbacterium allomyrinae TaxID=2830666 RepID=A0A9X1LXA6_9MICO|nr:helix-turn-helix domain-containing protein [Microbacterium allomyrinae]MCC2033080.1 hypothetical protein [Microbacterium allomyrinae]